MGRLNGAIDRLEDVGTDIANRITREHPILVPAAIAVLVVSVLYLGRARGFHVTSALWQDLIAGAVFFRIAYAEIRAHHNESSRLSRLKSGLATWKREHPRAARWTGATLLVAGVLLVGALWVFVL